jgi:peptide/nickel transport system permease protein
VVEQVFSWHGMGELFVQGVLASDTNVVLACLVVSRAFVVLFNMAADILYAVLDPASATSKAGQRLGRTTTRLQ